MIYFLNIIVSLLFTWSTISFFHYFAFFDSIAILPLFFIIGLTYFRKGFEPIMLAAMCGVLLDFYSAYPFGLYLGLFLAAAIIVRLSFQEGMKELSFWAFTLISTVLLTVFYATQLLILYLQKIQIYPAKSLQLFVPYLIINALFMLLLYFFNNWYFEKLRVIENSYKRK